MALINVHREDIQVDDYLIAKIPCAVRRFGMRDYSVLRCRCVERIGKIIRVKTKKHKHLQDITINDVTEAWRETNENSLPFVAETIRSAS